jgi:hypothetical protein
MGSEPDKASELARVRTECRAVAAQEFRGRWPNPEHRVAARCSCVLGICERCLKALREREGER